METLRNLYVAFGVILVFLSLPLIYRRIPPNFFYGFRIPSTLRDPELWYEVNAYSGKWLLAAGVVSVVTAVIAAKIPGISVDNYAWTCLAGLLIVMVPGLIRSFQKVNRLKKKV